MRGLTRLLIGTGVGVVLSFLVPPENSLAIFQNISQVVIHIGRYVLFPFVFFKIIASITQTRSINHVQLNMHLLLLYLTTMVVVVILAVCALLIVPLPRIPLIYQEIPHFDTPSLTQIITQIFPKNFFSILSGTGNFILPILVGAFILGYAIKISMPDDTHLSEICEKLSTAFYTISNIFVSLLGVGAIALTTLFVINIQLVTDISIFLPLIFTLGVEMLIIVLLIFPLIAKILNVGPNPYTILSKLFIPALMGGVSSDSYIGSPILLRSLHKEYPTKLGLLTQAVTNGMVFCKPGTILVAITSFVVVSQSYSAVEIEFIVLVQCMVLAIVMAPVASAYPSGGAVVLIMLLASLYGRGLENSYLLLVPITFILLGIAIFIDTIAIGYLGHIALQKLSRNSKNTPKRDHNSSTESGKEATGKRTWRVKRTIIS